MDIDTFLAVPGGGALHFQATRFIDPRSLSEGVVAQQLLKSQKIV
jgi:hypothetical protein